MSNLFIQEKERQGLTFLDLGNRLKPKTNRGTVHKYLSNPGYWSKKTILRICDALSIPHDKGIEAWIPLRREYLNDLVDKKLS